ncbi:hypothetical protein EV644_105266 [Kribbella orskensis]|uniref:Uncharacterized protein n=1 Tax=Kribbella orskensis TaxID=2512216 RepID=A0ABY2BPN1_9ACTN|nr:hypothetical protein EV642_104266 [Kribbella sp. VKM Ac-2500]TCO24233.1 hypothetical protein EV644_105266 [Kribbella orskensis]
MLAQMLEPEPAAGLKHQSRDVVELNDLPHERQRVLPYARLRRAQRIAEALAEGVPHRQIRRGPPEQRRVRYAACRVTVSTPSSAKRAAAVGSPTKSRV